MNWTPEQMKLCCELARLLEKKTGEKREPKVGEWWAYRSGAICMITADLYNERKQRYYNTVLMNDKGHLIAGFNTRFDLLHPLYTEGELLEIIRQSGIYCGSDPYVWTVIVNADNLLTALLELAVKVVKGGKGE